MKKYTKIIVSIIIIICIFLRIFYVNLNCDKTCKYEYEFGEECCFNDIIYKIQSVNIYDDIKNSDKQLKDYKCVEEKQNKELLKNKLESLIKAINSNDFNNSDNFDIDEILNMISPWHRDAFMEGKIKYDELKDYINKWYNDVYNLID